MFYFYYPFQKLQYFYLLLIEFVWLINSVDKHTFSHICYYSVFKVLLSNVKLKVENWKLIFHFPFSIYNLTLVGLSGLEPPTSRLSGGRSNRLSYKPICLVAGDQCLVVSFSLTCVHFHSSLFESFKPLVEIIGIEPMTPCLQSRGSPSWAIPPIIFKVPFVTLIDCVI